MVALPIIDREPSTKTTQNNNFNLLVQGLGGGYKNFAALGTKKRFKDYTLAYDFVTKAERDTLMDFAEDNRGEVIQVPVYLDDITGATTGNFVLVGFKDSAAADPSLYNISLSLTEVP